MVVVAMIAAPNMVMTGLVSDTHTRHEYMHIEIHGKPALPTSERLIHDYMATKVI